MWEEWEDEPAGVEQEEPKGGEEVMEDAGGVCQGVENGDCVSGIASRIGTVIDEVWGKSLKTFAVHLPQEWPDTSLPNVIETGGAVSQIAFRIGGRIPKTFGAQQPQECLDTPLPAWSGHPQSPKTINANGKCQ